MKKNTKACNACCDSAGTLCSRMTGSSVSCSSATQEQREIALYKSTARHQSIETGDKPIHSVERAALHPGIALIKGKLSCLLFFWRRQRRLKRTCIDFTLISLYVKTFEGDQVVCFFSWREKTTTSDPSSRVSLGDTLWSLLLMSKEPHRRPRLGANLEKT